MPEGKYVSFSKVEKAAAAAHIHVRAEKESEV